MGPAFPHLPGSASSLLPLPPHLSVVLPKGPLDVIALWCYFDLRLLISRGYIGEDRDFENQEFYTKLPHYPFPLSLTLVILVLVAQSCCVEYVVFR